MSEPLLRNDPAFLAWYAQVLEHEASVRPGQNVAWMQAGAERARKVAGRKPEAGEAAA